MDSVLKVLAVLISAAVLIPILDYGWHAWVGHGPMGLPTRADHLEHHRTASAIGTPWVEIRRNLLLVTGVALALGLVRSWVFGAVAGMAIALAWWIGYGAITFSHA